MAKIVWLASYPKSGNTWMRVFLSNYLLNGEAPADINDLKGGSIASSRAWFDEWVGIEASSLNETLVESLRPEAYRCMAREESNTIYMKVHDSWSLTVKGEGLFPADVTAGVVYIVRNPLDMAASCANQWGLDIQNAVKCLCDPEFVRSSSQEALADQLAQKMGTWSNHVASWLECSQLSVHVVRYEDLQHDPARFFGNVVRYLGLDFDETRVGRAVKFSSFKGLQLQEMVKGFSERPTVSKVFFRKGIVGGWQEELSTDLVKRIINVNGETMRRFGYLDENYQPL